MERRFWTCKVVFTMASALCFCLAGRAQQEAPGMCPNGHLSDYLGKPCTVGDLVFKFEEQCRISDVAPKKIGVSPVLSPAGLKFTFPAIPLPQHQTVQELCYAEVGVKDEKSPLIKAGALAGSLVEGFEVEVHLSALQKNRVEMGDLQLKGKLVKSTVGAFRKAIRVVPTVQYHVLVHKPSAARVSFESRFSG